MSISSPGNPDNCHVWLFHEVFSSKSACREINQDCRLGKLGCGHCKMLLGHAMKEELSLVSEKFHQLKDQDCEELLEEETKKVRVEIQGQWNLIKEKIGF